MFKKNTILLKSTKNYFFGALLVYKSWLKILIIVEPPLSDRDLEGIEEPIIGKCLKEIEQSKRSDEVFEDSDCEMSSYFDSDQEI